MELPKKNFFRSESLDFEVQRQRNEQSPPENAAKGAGVLQLQENLQLTEDCGSAVRITKMDRHFIA